MAHVEAAVVVHLRSVYYPDDPLSLFPLSLLSTRDLSIELVREAATLVMILSVAAIAEKKSIRVFAAFIYVFGLWDIFYYVWLKVSIGWPVSWLEWDILFLIPWPWLAPWLSAALIAAMFVVRGFSWLRSGDDVERSLFSWFSFAVGALLVLATFLLPAVPQLAVGEDAFRSFEPGAYRWGVYGLGYVLMLAGLFGNHSILSGRAEEPASRESQ
jgi:hypothetical protein